MEQVLPCRARTNKADQMLSRNASKVGINFLAVRVALLDMASIHVRQDCHSEVHQSSEKSANYNLWAANDEPTPHQPNHSSELARATWSMGRQIIPRRSKVSVRNLRTVIRTAEIHATFQRAAFTISTTHRSSLVPTSVLRYCEGGAPRLLTIAVRDTILLSTIVRPVTALAHFGTALKESASVLPKTSKVKLLGTAAELKV